MTDRFATLEREAHAMLDVLAFCPPRDMEELTIWTGDTTTRGIQSAESRAFLGEEE